MPLPMQNYDEARRNAEFMNMRAAQMTAERNGQKWMQQPEKAAGSRRQKIATGIAVAAVILVLAVLSALRII